MFGSPRIWTAIFASILALACAGCATRGTPFGIAGPDRHETPATPPQPGELPAIKVINDPIEGVNRVSYAFSDGLVYYVFRPVGKGYRAVLPRPVRKSINRFADNLGFPLRLVANSLQGKGVAAASETGRFVINTTIGIGGFFDPATPIGLKAHPEDFGQAFGSWGMGPGFYFMIPILGPASLRDGVGRIFDTALDPATYVPGLGSFFFLNRFSFLIDEYEIQREGASDPYILLRDVWGIQRESDVRDFKVRPDPAAEPPDPTIAALLFKPQTPRFIRKGPERRAKIEATGRSLPYTAWMQPKPAPLAYIIPGAGAHRDGAFVRAFAEILTAKGYSVAAISSPLNYEFIRNASTVPIPGYTLEDSADICRALAAVQRDLESDYPKRITSTALIGLSLGGLEAVFVAATECEKKTDSPSFDKYLAINPPAELGFALKQLDDYYNVPMQWDEQGRALKVEHALMKAALLLAPSDKPLAGPPPISKAESQFLIGASYRLGLRDAIFESQRRQDLGVLYTKASWFNRDARADEIASYSYREYLEKFGAPFLKTKGEGSVADLLQSSGLHSLEAALAANPRVRIVTNANDFVLSPEDIQWMKETFGPRLVVFPDGGHMGNLYVPEVQEAIVGLLQN